MFNKEVAAKVLIWRIIVVPLSMLLAYYFIGDLFVSTMLMIASHIMFTILHYIFELSWDKFAANKPTKIMRGKCNEDLYNIYGGD